MFFRWQAVTIPFRLEIEKETPNKFATKFDDKLRVPLNLSKPYMVRSELVQIKASAIRLR